MLTWICFYEKTSPRDLVAPIRQLCWRKLVDLAELPDRSTMLTPDWALLHQAWFASAWSALRTTSPKVTSWAIFLLLYMIFLCLVNWSESRPSSPAHPRDRWKWVFILHFRMNCFILEWKDIFFVNLLLARINFLGSSTVFEALVCQMMLKLPYV